MEENIEKDMSPKLIQDLGIMFASEGNKERRRYGLYKCGHCGEEFKAKTTRIKSGVIKSCGCLGSKIKSIHGLTSHKFYHTWNGMVQRCTNHKDKRYKNYGGRGITVCEEWLDIRNFVTWAEKTYPNIEGHTLDRIDNAKGYSPENCRWADKTTQAVNQRIKSTNVSGYTGVFWNPINKNWRASLIFKNEKINLGSHKTIEEAAQARDNYIIENNLPHKLSTEY